MIRYGGAPCTAHQFAKMYVAEYGAAYADTRWVHEQRGPMEAMTMAEINRVGDALEKQAKRVMKLLRIDDIKQEIYA